MSEIVKCSNRNCGLIAPLETWRDVKTVNPLVTEKHCPRCDCHSFFKTKPGEVEKIKTGAQLIALERRRQLLVEGWTPEHDDKHKLGQMAGAAGCYALRAAGFVNPHCIEALRNPEDYQKVPLWPWALSWWKPGNNVRDLVKAGALIAAEIDRLQRLRP